MIEFMFCLWLAGMLGDKPAGLGLLWAMLARTGVFAASAVTWVHTPELYATRVRATGHAVSNSCAQLGSFCAPFLLTTGGDGLVGGLLAALSALAMMCVLTLPETSGVCLDGSSSSSSSVKEGLLFGGGAGASERKKGFDAQLYSPLVQSALDSD